MTGTGSALLAGILDDPDDDARRLVYADWLEEDGRDPVQAAFIRAMIAANRSGEVPGFDQSLAFVLRRPGKVSLAWHDGPNEPAADWHGWEREVYLAARARTYRDVGRGLSVRVVRHPTVLIYRRGFVWGFVGSVRQWRSYKLWRDNPVEVVAWTLNDVPEERLSVVRGELDRVRVLMGCRNCSNNMYWNHLKQLAERNASVRYLYLNALCDENQTRDVLSPLRGKGEACTGKP